MARFHLIATGGTIASHASRGGLLAGATGRDLLAAAALTPDDIDVDDLEPRGSYALTLADLGDLVGRIRRVLDGGADAVVVTHGTDTMEETAFLLELFHNDPRPVVLTGAQRPFDDAAPDGPANLAAAFTVAGSPHARDCGVLVAFDGLAWPARGVRKVETLGAAAFAAPGRGPLLRVTPGGVLALGSARRGPAFEPQLANRLPRVDVVAAYVGSDQVLLRAAVDAGARGLVLQALGAGNVPAPVTEAVGQLVRDGVPVLVCSRVPSGPVAPLYTGGGGADLSRAGALFAADLSAWQARLLLSVALAAKPDDAGAMVNDWLEHDRAPSIGR